MRARFQTGLFLCVLLTLSAHAQTLTTQPTPFTALIDFSLVDSPFGTAQPLPIWLESVRVIHTPAPQRFLAPGLPEASGSAASGPFTTFRFRLRPLPTLNGELYLRLFFDDLPEARPAVTAWSETGRQHFASPLLGEGIGMPSSQALALPTEGVAYLDISVMGTGKNVSKALLSTLKKQTLHTPADFPAPAPLGDPFSGTAVATQAPPPAPAGEDAHLYGRIRATLEPGIVRLTPAELLNGVNPSEEPDEERPSDSARFDFTLKALPLVALLTFEILNADPNAPLQAWVNQGAARPVAIQLPDLADPGYIGHSRPRRKMRFYYAGWVRCQYAIPASALQVGENSITVRLPADAAPTALRGVELQLKHPWQKLDYLLTPQ